MNLKNLFLIPCSLFLATAAAVAAPTPPFPLMPYTYVGRVVDSTHVAFDGENAVQLRLKDLSGRLLAKCTTYSSETSPYNYRLDVPMASGPTPGCATNGQLVAVEVIDALGTTWTGLIPPSKCRIGRAGDVCHCNIVVAEDRNANGVADDYEDYMYFKMYWNGIDGDYNPAADYDGDGQSNYAEYIAGTDPFDASDRFSFSMLECDPADDEDVLRFSLLVSPGRVYRVLESLSLGKDASWADTSFWTEQSGDAAVKRFVTGPMETGYRTFYLIKKKDAKSDFFRLDVE